MARVKIWTAPEPFYGYLVAEALIERNVPVFTTHRWTGLVWYNPTPLEVWIEDDALLDDIEIQNTIRQVIDGMPLTDNDSEQIEDMPFVDVPERPLFSKRAIFFVALSMALFVALVIYLNTRG